MIGGHVWYLFCLVSELVLLRASQVVLCANGRGGQIGLMVATLVDFLARTDPLKKEL